MTAGLLGFAVSGLIPEGDPRRTLWLALAAIVACSLLAAGAPAFGFVLAARAGQGVGIGLLVAGGLADVARRAAPGQGGRLTGAVIGGTAMGGLLSRLSGYSAFLLGWRGAFLAGGLAALLLAGAALRRLGVSRPGRSQTPRPPGQSAIEERTPWLIVGAGLFILFVNIGVFDLLPYRLAQPPFRLPTYLADLVYLAFVPATLTAYVAGPAVDRFGPRRVAAVTCVFGIACLLVGLLPNLLAEALMATGSISGSVSLHICHSGAAARHGRAAVGRYLTAYYIGGAASAPLAAATFQAWGWAGAVAPFCAAWAVVGLLALSGGAERWQRGAAAVSG
jgi:MFS transporter, YNFM family, putative membrane transport protein